MTYVVHKLHDSEYRLACGIDPDLFPSTVHWRQTTCSDCLEKVGKVPRGLQTRVVGRSRKVKKIPIWEPYRKVCTVMGSLNRSFGKQKEVRELKFGDTWRMVARKYTGEEMNFERLLEPKIPMHLGGHMKPKKPRC